MAKKTKPRKSEEVSLSQTQLSHLIHGAVRNIVDLKVSETKNGVRFLFILDCLNAEDCIPANVEPESEEEIVDIAACHGVVELYEYFENVVSIRNDQNVSFRAFDTVEINKKNMGNFVKCLTELDDYWNQIDKDLEDEQDFKNKTQGKNLVQGNETLN